MKKLTFAILALIGMSVVGYVAGALGYLVGGPQYAARFAPGDALYTVAVLRKLREDETEEAIDLLERQLDSHIVAHSAFDPDIAKWLDIMEPISETNRGQLMTKVAKYRAEHPSKASDSEVREYINSHLKRYSP